MLSVHGGHDGPAEPGTAQHYHCHPLSDHLPQVSNDIIIMSNEYHYHYNHYHHFPSLMKFISHRPIANGIIDINKEKVKYMWL